MQVLIVADDLTGALDTASPFACNGMKVRVCTSLDAALAMEEAGCDVLSVSTNSRHLPPHEAAALATNAAELAARFTPRLVLKKVDSRLKGNVRVESFALARKLGSRRLLVVPAAPDIGRFVSGGSVVGAGVDTPISVAEKFSGTDERLQIPDVLGREDLLRLAEELLKSDGVLAVCSRGLAIALASIMSRGSAVPFHPTGPVLIGIGSRDPVTREQVMLLQSEGEFRTVLAPDGEVSETEAAAGQLILQMTGDGPQSEAAADRFASGLCRVMDVMRPATMLLSGGDTAAAVMNRLNFAALEVCGEAAPGLPWCKVPLYGKEVQVISKSGGFGHAGTLVELFGPGSGQR